MQNPPGLSIELDGETHTFTLADYTGEDDHLCHKVTQGVTLSEIFIEGKITLFTLAALVWLKKRKRDPKLTYQKVCRSIGFSTLRTLDIVGDIDEGTEEGPEA